MAFTVGVNSFVSVADADAYFTDRGNASWTGTDTEKENALIRGTDYLVQKYTARWRGTLTSLSQVLPWPRIGVVTSDGQIIASTTMPAAVENATSEMGLRALSNSDLFADTGAGTESLKRNKVDVLEKEFFQGASTQNTYTNVVAMLKDYTINFGNAIPLTRGCDQSGGAFWNIHNLRT